MGNTISRAATAAGVHVETVRYYERRGLIDRPHRPAGGGFRVYPPTTVRRIRFIRRAQSLGFSLAEVRDLLSLRSDPATGCQDIRARAVERLGKIDEVVSDLMRKRTALAAVIDTCPGGGALHQCAILEALDA